MSAFYPDYDEFDGDGCDVAVDEMTDCPVCGGDAAEMGCLGRLMWYHCVCCGAEFNKEDHVRDCDQGGRP
jgi:hypothetical protein